MWCVLFDVVCVCVLIGGMYYVFNIGWCVLCFVYVLGVMWNFVWNSVMNDDVEL